MPAASPSPSLPVFAPDFAATHGCAWFEPATAGARNLEQCSAVASVAGLPSFLVSSWRDLSPEVVWWTNLSRAEAWSLGRWTQIRDGGLFGPDWSGWLAERATPTEIAQVQYVCPGIAETFARIGCWLSQWATHQNPQRPWSWGAGSLPDLLADRLGWTEAAPPQTPQAILDAAYLEQTHQSHPALAAPQTRCLVLSLPRRRHAAHLFRQRHPSGPWEVLSEGAWPRDPSAVPQWLLDQASPLLIKLDRLTWLNPDDPAGPLWLGQRGCRFVGAQSEPIWMTGEEACVYARHARVIPLAAYTARHWSTTSVPVGFRLDPIEHEPLLDLALSQGLLAASLWRAAATPTRHPTTRHRSVVSPRAIWWRAADRQRCFEAALMLERSGFRTAWHGQGQVAVLFEPTTDPAALATAIASAGLLMPGMLALSMPPTLSADPTVMDMDHWLKRVATLEERLDIDRLTAPWLGPTQVKPILQEAVQRLLALPTPSPSWAALWTDRIQRQARASVNRLKSSLGTS